MRVGLSIRCKHEAKPVDYSLRFAELKKGVYLIVLLLEHIQW